MAAIRRLRRANSVAKIVEVYDAHHGRGAFRGLISTAENPRTKQQVSNYKTSGRLPPDTFLIVGEALKTLGYVAPPSLWGIVQPKAQRAA